MPILRKLLIPPNNIKLLLDESVVQRVATETVQESLQNSSRNFAYRSISELLGKVHTNLRNHSLSDMPWQAHVNISGLRRKRAGSVPFRV